MSGAKTFYITTPIYYVNDKPHIGHAYTTLACDVLARFKRLDGFDVKFLTGTDEHGQKVEKSAEAAGVPPLALADQNSANFKELAGILGCSNDDFIRTTEPRHLAACQALWTKLLEKGDIYLGAYEGWYSVRDEAFYAEDELVKEPNGAKLAPTGAPVEWVKEPSYFFRLSAWQDRLLQWYEDNPDCVGPNSRRNEVMSFVKGGLQDLSVSRTSFKWGIPVPGDDAHIMYVWLDALTNYITALGYPDTSGDFARYWPNVIHMVGKDIVRFHAVYWPAFLMAADLPPPKRVFAHGWWTNEGQKISKSVGNVIDPLSLIETYGLDQVRYFLLREVPFGNDGDFSHRAMMGRMNSELANDYGNLVQRVLSMIGKNCGGQVPERGPATGDDSEMLAPAYGLLARLRDAMDRQLYHEALEAIWMVVRAANAYVDKQAPWGLKKTDPARMGTVLWTLAETIRLLALATQPFMPTASNRILDLVAVPEGQRDYRSFSPVAALVTGTPLPSPQGVFPRYVEEVAS
ncbi:methionine--tRNA ligase [Paramagnetospirillum marisnigri]|uniref:Methionine--tRNA ligase n=1 Tax=Paramagnetospirillum marisnigri TaxID=1285242 RepID=A0A178M664_9PROT|nr:methionine--tRNA ligase [Paramagnetospirillum marisnigri]OAN44016.1 methionine--tRNA ligase [Paramagnetospirillum marisnigri]